MTVDIVLRSTPPVKRGRVLDVVNGTHRAIISAMGIEIAKEHNTGCTRDGLELSAVLNHGLPEEAMYHLDLF